MKYLYACLALGFASISAASCAEAATVLDAVGDFAPGYIDAASDLDVTSFSVGYDSTTQDFSLAATMAGLINPATAGVYIIGVNTGTGPNAPFAAIGAPNVRFNQTLRINKDGTALLGSSTLNATIVGNLFTISVPLSLLASTGFTPEQYGWNLWPRNGIGAGTFATDFAPDNAMLAVNAAVPEPRIWTMMILGFGVAGAALRRCLKGTKTVRFA